MANYYPLGNFFYLIDVFILLANFLNFLFIFLLVQGMEIKLVSCWVCLTGLPAPGWLWYCLV